MKRLSQVVVVMLLLSLLVVPFFTATRVTADPDKPDQNQRALSIPSGIPDASHQPQAGAAVIAVFDDPAYVDTEGSTSSESDNVQAGLAALGFSVVPFTGTTAADFGTALAGADVLVIPELEANSNLGNDLSPQARTVITNFVSQGGGLIEFYQGPEFLNLVFGFSLGSQGASLSRITAAATGTAFTNGPAWLPANNATDSLDSSTFPAGGQAIYSSGGINAEVAWLPFGNGQIVYLGWDWYDAAPPGAQDNGWLEVLDRAVIQLAGGMRLFPSNSQRYGLPGSSVVHTLTLINYTGITDTYTLALGGNVWTTVRPFAVTPSMPPSTTLKIPVTVTISAGATVGASDLAKLTVTSVTSPGVYTDATTLRTTVPSGRYGYVFTEDSNQIEVLDTIIHEAVGTIDTTPYGDTPFLGGLSPNGQQLYVSLYDSNRVLIVDTATQTPYTPTLAVGNEPRNVAFAPNGAYAFVPNRGSGTVSVIDTAARAVTATLTVGNNPMIVATSPCLDKAYVTNRTSNTVSVINTTALTVTKTITGFNHPWGIVVSPFGRWAYVVNQEDNTIGVIDTTTDQLIATWAIKADWLQMVDVSPDGRTLYVVDADGGAVLTLDAFSGETLNVIPAERSEAWYVETFPAGAGNYAYFSRTDAQAVGVIDTATQRLVKSISLSGGGQPRGLAFFPQENTCLSGTAVVAPAAPHRVAPTGQKVTFREDVINLSTNTNTYALTSSISPWTTTLSANTTGPLAPGARFPVTMTVELPASALPGAFTSITLTATSGGGSNAAKLTASVLHPGFVFNKDENVIHVVDTRYHLDSGLVISTSAYGSQPLRGTLSPDSSKLYVGLRNDNRVLIVDTKTLTPTVALPVGDAPQDVAFSVDGTKAFVANRNNDTLAVIDTAVPTVTLTLPVGNEPMSLAAACSGKLYVALRADNAVAIVDTSVMTVTKVITGFNEPHGLTLAPTCQQAYVVNQGGDSIGVINTATDSLIATWPIIGADWLSDVDISPDGQRLYVADAELGDVHVLNAATGAVLAHMTGTGDGWTAWEVETFSPSGGPFVYATFSYDGWVGVFNTTSNTWQKAIQLGTGGDLRGMALFPPLRLCRNIYLPLILKHFTP